MVTSVQREGILQIVVGLFGAAPGKQNQELLEGLVDGGMSVQELANFLASSPLFTSTILAGNTTPESQVAILMNKFGLVADPTDLNTAGSQAAAFFTESLANGAGFGAIVHAAVNFLETEPLDPIFVPTATLLANKVKVADLYSAQVTPENSNDVSALQDVLAGVVTSGVPLTDLQAQAIVDPFVVPEPGEPFSLSSGLVALAAAEAEKDTFLLIAGQDPEIEGDEAAATEADIATAAANAVTSLDALVDGNYAGSTTAVRAALLSDEVALRAGGLTTAETAKAEAQAAIDTVPGLTDAVTAFEAAKDAAAAAEVPIAANGSLTANLAAALVNFNTLNGTAATIDADGTDNTDAFIAVNGSGDLALVDGITEETTSGVTALLAASVAFEAGEVAANNANTAENDAKLAVNILDLDAAGTAALAAVGAGMVAVTPTDASSPTTEEVVAEASQLTAFVANHNADIGDVTFAADEADTETAHATLTAAAVTAGFISAADETAINLAFNDAQGADDTTTAAAISASQAALAANNGIDDFQLLVDDFIAAADTNDLLSALTTADTAVDDAQDEIDALDTAVAALANADAGVTELASLNNAITAAETAFTDNELEVPVTLVGGANNATTNNDIFLFDDQVVASSITNFSLLSDDTLFIGDGFTFNPGDITTDGNDSVLEVFATEDASNTVIAFETSVFGSSAVVPEIFEITLTGIALADVALADGVVTIV